MSRDLETAALAAVTAEVVPRMAAVELHFPSGVVRYCGSPYDIEIGGETFYGVGALGSVSTVEETSDLRSQGLVVTLTGIPRDIISAALTEAYQNKPGLVYEVPIGDDGLPVDAPFVTFRGRMDQMDVSLGETATVSVRLENRLADWDRPRSERYTDEDHQAKHPGDKFFEFVSDTAEKDISWGVFR